MRSPVMFTLDCVASNFIFGEDGSSGYIMPLSDGGGFTAVMTNERAMDKFKAFLSCNTTNPLLRDSIKIIFNECEHYAKCIIANHLEHAEIESIDHKADDGSAKIQVVIKTPLKLSTEGPFRYKSDDSHYIVDFSVRVTPRSV